MHQSFYNSKFHLSVINKPLLGYLYPMPLKHCLLQIVHFLCIMTHVATVLKCKYDMLTLLLGSVRYSNCDLPMKIFALFIFPWYVMVYDLSFLQGVMFY